MRFNFDATSMGTVDRLITKEFFGERLPGPQYSGDMNAAWRIVAHMSGCCFKHSRGEGGLSVRLTYTQVGLFEFVLAEAIDDRGEVFYQATAASTATALCALALRAKGHVVVMSREDNDIAAMRERLGHG